MFNKKLHRSTEFVTLALTYSNMQAKNQTTITIMVLHYYYYIVNIMTLSRSLW